MKHIQLLMIVCVFTLISCNEHLSGAVTIKNASDFDAQDLRIYSFEYIDISLLRKGETRSFSLDGAGVPPHCSVRYMLNNKKYGSSNERDVIISADGRDYWQKKDDVIRNGEHGYITIYNDYWLFEK